MSESDERYVAVSEVASPNEERHEDLAYTVYEAGIGDVAEYTTCK